jgi:hypothetical protein
VKVGLDGLSTEGPDDDVDEDTLAAEQKIASLLLTVLCDGSPLVRAELAIGENKALLLLSEYLLPGEGLCYKEFRCLFCV